MHVVGNGTNLKILLSLQKLKTNSMPLNRSLTINKQRGCVKSHFLCYKAPLEARMASSQSDFFDFLGLFTQPQHCRTISKGVS